MKSFSSFSRWWFSSVDVKQTKTNETRNNARPCLIDLHDIGLVYQWLHFSKGKQYTQCRQAQQHKTPVPGVRCLSFDSWKKKHVSFPFLCFRLVDKTKQVYLSPLDANVGGYFVCQQLLFNRGHAVPLLTLLVSSIKNQ